MVRKLLYLRLSLFLLLFISNLYAGNLVIDGDFESGTKQYWNDYGLKKTPSGWNVITSTEGYIYSGVCAAKLTDSNKSASYIYQVITVVSTSTYTASAHFYDDFYETSGSLAIYWYETGNGTGKNIGKISTSTVNSSNWQYLSLENLTPPEKANSCKLELRIKNVVDGTYSIYVDSITFVQLFHEEEQEEEIYDETENEDNQNQEQRKERISVTGLLIENNVIFTDKTKPQTTLIYYGLESEFKVTIKIFDIKGNGVRILLDNCSVSTGFVEWDGTDDFGNVLPIGVYIVSLNGVNINNGKVIRKYMPVAIGKRLK